ncbi:hypothetical protein AWB79_06937 [Caballeronia hypogeia]|uniref:Uncharacterized protein n=1 Tax=Caballeronia hypogeia TaxID=1777140 RepID=A0A158DG16_9BURK|nr:hypothetical protein AWB79_06937 [Caballeronia hypogeia]
MSGSASFENEGMSRAPSQQLTQCWADYPSEMQFYAGAPAGQQATRSCHVRPNRRPTVRMPYSCRRAARSAEAPPKPASPPKAASPNLCPYPASVSPGPAHCFQSFAEASESDRTLQRGLRQEKCREDKEGPKTKGRGHRRLARRCESHRQSARVRIRSARRSRGEASHERERASFHQPGSRSEEHANSWAEEIADLLTEVCGKDAVLGLDRIDPLPLRALDKLHRQLLEDAGTVCAQSTVVSATLDQTIDQAREEFIARVELRERDIFIRLVSDGDVAGTAHQRRYC